AVLVEAAGLPYAVPLDRVERTLRLDEHPIRSIAGRRLLVLRDGARPVLDLAESLGHAPHAATHAVLVRGAGQRLALAVANVAGQRELVTRPLPRGVADGAALSGAAVLPTGEIALIVDCDALAEAGARSMADAA